MKNIQIPKELFLDLCRHHLAGIRSPEQDQRIQQGLQNKLDAVKDGLTIKNRGLLMIKKIFRTIKNILFPRVYMPWEQPGITDLSSAELQELIALIDAHLAELDENGEIE